MHHFLNFPIKWKLVLGFSIGIASLLLVAGAALFAMTALRDTQTDIQEIHLNNTIDYLELDASLNSNRVLLLRMMRGGSAAARERLQREIADGSAENDIIMARLAARVLRDPLPQDKFAALKAAREDFNRMRDTQVIPAILAGRQAEAEAAFATNSERYAVASRLASELVGLAKDSARLAVERSIVMVRNSAIVLGATALAAVALSILAVVGLHRTIALPITGMAATATLIGAGELDRQTLDEDRQDEVGELARAFNRMTASLRDLADIADKIANGDLTSRVRPRSRHDRLVISFDIMSENLKGLVGEMKSGAAEVNAATVEILELTREFLLEMADRGRAQRFQDALLRLEEVGKRLDLVVGRIKVLEEK